jgi:hypothetical protein
LVIGGGGGDAGAGACAAAIEAVRTTNASASRVEGRFMGTSIGWNRGLINWVIG